MSDRILGAVCLVLASGMAWASASYVAPISYEPIGPRAFPWLLSMLLGLCGACLLVKTASSRLDLSWQRCKPIALSAVVILVYAALFQTLGFPVATTLMAVPVGMAFGGTWRQSLLAGAGLGIGFYLVFDKLFDVVLPTGVLSFLVGGH